LMTACSPRRLQTTSPYFVVTTLDSHAENNVELTMLVPLINATFTPRLTPLRLPMTTQNPSSPSRLTLGLVLLFSLTLLFAGCATPGPNHTYVAPADSQGDAPILDFSTNAAVVEIPAWLKPGEQLTGVAYDPFTDHLFLRLAPGNLVRVIDRPARKIFREFTATGVPATRGGDLAIRSRDRHLFFAHPTEPSVIETTLTGEFVREIKLENQRVPPPGLAYDQVNNLLLTVNGGDLDYISFYALDGHRLRGVALGHLVMKTALAYDSAASEFYIPLLQESAIGVFDLHGELLRKIPVPPGQSRAHLDVGPRSFFRVF
jgi:hypothetical protein